MVRFFHARLLPEEGTAEGGAGHMMCMGNAVIYFAITAGEAIPFRGHVRSWTRSAT